MAKEQSMEGPLSNQGVEAVDVVVRWGEDCVLWAKEMCPPRSVFIGEEDGCDVALPKEIAGGSRVPVLLARWDGTVRVVVPKGARVFLDGKIEGKGRTGARAIARGEAIASQGSRDAAELSLVEGRRVAVRVGPITVEMSGSKKAPKMARDAVMERRLGLSHMGSSMLHGMALGALSLFSPAVVYEDTGMSDEQLFDLRQRLQTLDDKEFEYEEQLSIHEQRARRRERRRVARSAAEGDEAWFQMLWAASERWANEERAAAMAAEEAAEGAGVGRPKSLIGLLYEQPKTRKTRTNQGSTQTQTQTTRRPSSQTTTRATTRSGGMQVNGRLPPEVIHRIVRQNFGRFRLCYEQGLRNNPNLQGRVNVRFVIGRDGGISNVSNGGSDLPDGGVVNCITRSLYGLTFPQPEAGIVTVVLPLRFAPGG